MPSDTTERQSSGFPMWEVVLIAAVVLLLIVFLVLKIAGPTMSPDQVGQTVDGQTDLDSRDSLGESVEDPLTPAERAEALEHLNQPVKDPLTPAERAEALEHLDQSNQ